ncbi:MAG: RodZ domain-containing protein [Cyanobacteria bacterium P01_A01_bin.37]
MGQHTAQPSEHQVEALMQIGGYLHEIREGQLLSLEQVATETLIQARLLRAIETADFNQLPEPVYIRGFIRRYAEALGLDGSVVAAKFPVEIDQRSIQASWNKSTSQLRPTHLWIAYTVIIIAAIGGLHQYLTRFSSPASQASNTLESQQDETTTLETDDSTATSPTNAPPTATSPTTSDSPIIPSSDVPDDPESSAATAETFPEGADPDSPIKVTIELTERSWLRVVVDGQPQLEEVLPEGTQQTWAGTQSITIRAGNAGGVLLAQNGSEAELMGDPGSVREVSFSANSQNEGG